MKLMNGFTTIRLLGDQSSTAYYLRNAINSGIVVGPRMFVSEPQIEVDGGDLVAYRWDVRHDLEQYVYNRGNCTGVVECTKVVRQEDVVAMKVDPVANMDQLGVGEKISFVMKEGVVFKEEGCRSSP